MTKEMHLDSTTADCSGNVTAAPTAWLTLMDWRTVRRLDYPSVARMDCYWVASRADSMVVSWVWNWVVTTASSTVPAMVVPTARWMDAATALPMVNGTEIRWEPMMALPTEQPRVWPMVKPWENRWPGSLR